MKKISVSFAFLLCLGGIFFYRASDAAIYRYVDKDGVICFADNLQVIPEQCRATAVIVDNEATDDIKPSKPMVVTKTDMALSAAETKPENRGPRPLSIRLMISGAVGLSALMIFIVISRLPEFKENKKILIIIRASLIGMISLYLIVAHVKDMISLFSMAGRVVEDVQNQSAEKGKKAAQAIKSLDALFEEAHKAPRTQEPSTAESKDK
jgi:hypothetical protein